MSLMVVCSQCSQQMILQFVKVGEQFACRKCGAIGVVPEDAEYADSVSSVIPVSTYLKLPPSPDGTPSLRSSIEEKKKSAPTGIRVFSIVAATANALYLLLELIGLSTGEVPLDFASKVVVLVLFVIGGANITVLSGGWPFLRKALIACNLVIFIGLALLWIIVSDDPSVRIGAIMLLAVGITSATALSVCHRESWLSLRIERSRLEEMKRVADLRKELQLPEKESEGLQP